MTANVEPTPSTSTDRPYDRTTCPCCGVDLVPLPKAKSNCKACRQPRVRLPSGSYSSAQALKTIATAGDDGIVSWGWSVQSNTKRGTATVTVTCTLGSTKSAQAKFTIT